MNSTPQTSPVSAAADLKPSKYNSFVRREDGAYYGYNFLYRTIIRIPPHMFGDIVQLLSQTPSIRREEHTPGESPEVASESFQGLREAHFLIPRNLDELALIKFRYFRSLFANSTLSLIVLPTLRCNFTCPYCFEFKRPITMSSAVEQALLGWVEKTSRNMKHLTVDWFGGEPLLAKNTIVRLSERFQRLSTAAGISYWSSLTTNGFLLDPQFQDRLASLGIRHVQITLDGDEEAHNKSRRLKDGRGTFGRIYENILAFCEKSDPCILTLRLNCGDENYAGVEKLLGEFPPQVRAKARVFFRWIWANEATGYRDFSRKSRATASYDGLSRLYRAARALGWRAKNPLSKASGGYCEADRLNHFQIGPDGSVFVCSHTYRAADAIGSVLDGSGVVRPDAHNRYAQWYAAQPFDDPKCIDCALLPVCLGGCRKARVRGHPTCVDEIGRLESYTEDLINERLSRGSATKLY